MRDSGDGGLDIRRRIARRSAFTTSRRSVEESLAHRRRYRADRLSNANLVVLCDGSSLHARSVWRDNDFGEAINAAPLLVAVGSVATALGEVMIDPRGGAPTVGLGLRKGAAFCQPSSVEQMYRTRSLLADELLVTIGATGVVEHDGERWEVLGGDVVVTRGHDVTRL